MMFTIVVPAYNNPEFTLRCVESAIHSVDVLGLSTRFILIDDAATTGESTTEVFLKVRDRNSRFSTPPPSRWVFISRPLRCCCSSATTCC
jgi:glycosyltransferase involved in cell wall biosynthesis